MIVTRGYGRNTLVTQGYGAITGDVLFRGHLLRRYQRCYIYYDELEKKRRQEELEEIAAKLAREEAELLKEKKRKEAQLRAKKNREDSIRLEKLQNQVKDLSLVITDLLREIKEVGSALQQMKEEEDEAETVICLL